MAEQPLPTLDRNQTFANFIKISYLVSMHRGDAGAAGWLAGESAVGLQAEETMANTAASSAAPLPGPAEPNQIKMAFSALM